MPSRVPLCAPGSMGRFCLNSRDACWHLTNRWQCGVQSYTFLILAPNVTQSSPQRRLCMA